MSTKTPESPTGAASAEERSAFALDVEERSLRDAVSDWVGKVRTGDPGALPSVLGLIALGLIFSLVSDRFLSAFNLGNLPGQGAYIAAISLGLVFVLLLGEIDLSAGTAGGAAAAITAVGVSNGSLSDGLPGLMYWSLLVGLLVCLALAVWLKAYSAAVVIAVGFVLVVANFTQYLIPGLIAAICIGVAIGVFNGYLVAKVGIPSFVVTLALFLAWQGVLQFALSGQPVNTSRYALWHDLTYGNLSPLWSWIFVVVVVGGFIAYTVNKSLRARRAGLSRDGLQLVLLRGAIIAVVAVVLTLWLNQNRNTNPYKVISGIPVPAAILIVLMIICTIALTKTTWGRHLYATGGNAEAARRAGIDVTHMKVTAFALCSGFGAVGGILLASSQSSASLDLGSGNVLLFSVAAAVIGGTSLFGGRGRPLNAILGALVIAIIPNGLLLRPSLGAQWQQVITGVVLLVAAAVDAVSRRRATRG
ncbi:ABC transporter permease [Marmoricola endophyticus]|uniref:Xylose transport system permease protein XylH n=1 Tax=Marmoricola endophyticus TaxID=2040280 RepID=A0A917BSQ8_9ACTN|nr:ABC transporter permease [Marmoricola endophyticus]GGF54988.1 ABC transporter permease [Marmoricola endophyticus]